MVFYHFKGLNQFGTYAPTVFISVHQQKLLKRNLDTTENVVNIVSVYLTNVTNAIFNMSWL